jgi:hypothetical protein
MPDRRAAGRLIATRRSPDVCGDPGVGVTADDSVTESGTPQLSYGVRDAAAQLRSPGRRSLGYGVQGAATAQLLSAVSAWGRLKPPSPPPEAM